MWSSELHDSTSPAAACMNGLILIRLIAVHCQLVQTVVDKTNKVDHFRYYS